MLLFWWDGLISPINACGTEGMLSTQGELKGWILGAGSVVIMCMLWAVCTCRATSMWYAVAAEAVPRTRSLDTWRLSSSPLLRHSMYLAIVCLPIHLPGDQVMTDTHDGRNLDQVFTFRSSRSSPLTAPPPIKRSPRPTKPRHFSLDFFFIRPKNQIIPNTTRDWRMSTKNSREWNKSQENNRMKSAEKS